MEPSWESELGKLLSDLAEVQDELLDILGRKRELLKASDVDGLRSIAPQEEKLIDTLKECLRRRGELLAQARQEGLPAASISVLSRALPRSRRQRLDGPLKLVKQRTRLLQHQSLTNWVVAQRTLIHLSQMLEIIATGGRLTPTYGEGKTLNASGALVDRAA